jgi:mycothiol S-conjugate amidase
MHQVPRAAGSPTTTGGSPSVRDAKITTRVDIAAHYEVRSKALLAHATQVDPTERFWFGLPDEHAREAYPWDDYVLARSLVPTDVPEDDLFAGVRASVVSRHA